MQLVVRTGSRAGQIYPIESRPIRIGRDSSSTIRLDDNRASRHHAVIEPTGDGTWTCRDLDSTNHTYVNGESISTVLLQEGDVVRIGSTEIVFVQTGASATSTPKEIAVDMTQESLELAIRGTADSTSGQTSFEQALFRLSLLIDNRLAPEAYLVEALAIMRGCVPFSTWAWLEWPKNDVDEMRIRRGGGFDTEDSSRVLASVELIRRAIRRRTGLIGTAEDLQRSQSSPGNESIRSTLVIPLQTGESNGAALYLDRTSAFAEFHRNELEWLAALGSQVSLGLKNIHLFRKLERAFEELNQSQAELVRTEKMAGIGRLASGFAHDLNNPLSSIIGFLDLAKRICDRDNVPEKLERYLDRAHGAADYCRALSRNLLAFARQSPVQEESYKPYDAAETIEAAMNICFASLQKINARVVVDIPRGVTLYGDPTTLQQVVMNLVTNAADAISELGEEHEGLIEVIGTSGAAGLEIRIRDNGPGIPADLRERIFDALFTTKDQDRGTGLGLFVVKKIIEESNGTLALDSTPGKGTEFTIQLPAQLQQLGIEEETKTTIDLTIHDLEEYR